MVAIHLQSFTFYLDSDVPKLFAPMQTAFDLEVNLIDKVMLLKSVSVFFCDAGLRIGVSLFCFVFQMVWGNICAFRFECVSRARNIERRTTDANIVGTLSCSDSTGASGSTQRRARSSTFTCTRTPRCVQRYALRASHITRVVLFVVCCFLFAGAAVWRRFGFLTSKSANLTRDFA